jgi:hypothetical protein
VRSFRIGSAALALSCLAAACVDTSGDRPEGKPPIERFDPGSGPFDCRLDDDYEMEALDDFEMGSASGTWYSNNDVCEDCQAMAEERNALLGTIDVSADAGDADPEVESQIVQLREQLISCRELCDASQTPNIFDKPLPAELIPGERCGSRYALHIQTDKLIDWGANLGTSLVPPFDATPLNETGEAVAKWEGISFWARRAPYSKGTVRLEIADNYTDEKYIGGDGEPICNPDYTEDSLFEGCDRFGGYAQFGYDWDFFTLRFDELRQAGWGRQAPYMDLDALRSVTFLFPSGIWDIWIDDVAFYRRRAD